MRSNLKKWIILIVVFLIVAVGVLIAISMLDNFSTTTVYDIRFINVKNNQEFFDSEVYLTAEEQNYIDLKLSIIANSKTEYNVYSTNTDVATVEYNNGVYRVNYFRAGETTIVGTTVEPSNVKDSFVLRVVDNIPNSFNFVNDGSNEFVLGDKEVYIYADDINYTFDFVAQKGTISESINIHSIKVLDNFNTEIFESVTIDDANSKLNIKAKQSEMDTREYLTLQSKYTDEEGNLVTMSTFVICVNVKGNYICDLQLVLSERPGFADTVNIMGEGKKNEGEKVVEKVVTTAEVEEIYARVRVVYTNGEMFDVTQGAVVSGAVGDGSCSKIENKYLAISVIDTYNNFFTIEVNYNIVRKFTFYKYTNNVNINNDDYDNFMNNELYETEIIDGVTVYRFKYWDTRYKRLDAITDKNGNIIGFSGGNPACGA